MDPLQTDFRLDLTLKDESQTAILAALVADACDQQQLLPEGVIFYLQGDLGAGKSFFSRAFIQKFIPGQKVKSPTYTIVESYKFSTNAIHHLDLYRLCDPEELEYLAIRDLLRDHFVALVEWPQKGSPLLPQADVEVAIDHQPIGRTVRLTAFSEKGRKIVQQVMSSYRAAGLSEN